MILLVDLCWRPDSLSAFEFVDPIAQIVRETGRTTHTCHYQCVDAAAVDAAEAVILCGTALKDNAYSERMECFAWIRECERPIFGICAGMQVIGLAFGGSLVDCTEIGMIPLRAVREEPLFAGRPSFEAYALHSRALDPPDDLEVLAVSDNCIQAVRHRDRPIAGVLFHPEVRNPWAVTRFLKQYRY
jgi:GMP synthase-like glutamine amidotransferase